jgi:hypothetical protein
MGYPHAVRAEPGAPLRSGSKRAGLFALASANALGLSPDVLHLFADADRRGGNAAPHARSPRPKALARALGAVETVRLAAVGVASRLSVGALSHPLTIP